MTLTLNHIDLSDHDAFVDAVPHAAFAALRHEAPVHWNPEPDGPGFWAVTRYKDIHQVHRDTDTFSSETGGTSLEDVPAEHLEARKSMIDTDPPRHAQLRGMVNARFRAKAVGSWEDQVRMVTRQVLDEALPLKEFDFVEQISSEIPMQIFAEILGVPQEERRVIIEIGDRLLGSKDPEYSGHDEDAHAHLPFSSPAALEMFEFGRRLAEDRRRNPKDDIITQLAFEPSLTPQQYDTFFVLLATAGNETTRHTITHGLLALLEFPDQLEKLRHAEAGERRWAAEEMLRWATPVHHFRRTATVDTEIAGVEIKAGDKVTTWFTSGNRDETAFDQPDRFDIARQPNRHMAFGPGGVHFCLGAHLAKLEIRVVFEELLARVDRFELTGPPERLRSNFFNGIKRLPVRVSA